MRWSLHALSHDLRAIVWHFSLPPPHFSPLALSLSPVFVGRGLTLCCSICCHGNGDVLRELFIHALLRNAFGCNHVFLSYDLSLRRDLEPYEDPEQRDLRLPAPLQRLQEELRDHVDFSIDTIGSSQQLLELPLKRE